MAEPSETPLSMSNTNHNSTFIATIQPTTKLGGRGTPRRKTRRSNNINQAARSLENKLKPFRSQFQLQDHQEFCDITILYDDGQIETQKQVRVHSSWPMTIHEIDGSEAGTQIYHINDLDSASCEYLFGNTSNLQNEFDQQQSINTVNSTSSYYNNLQQQQNSYYPPSSQYYMNYMAYQQNPYATNYENYSNNIRQVYGGANTQSDDEPEEEETTKSSKKKRRRRNKHPKTTNEESSSIAAEIIPQEEEEVTADHPSENLENDDVTSTKTKRKRRRIRKSKKSLTSEEPPISIISDQSDSKLSPSIVDKESNENTLLSSGTPTQHAESLEEQQSMTNTVHTEKDVMNVIKNDEKKEKEIQPAEFPVKTTNISVDDITSTTFTHIPSVVIIDAETTEDENEKITHPVSDDESISPVKINQETTNQHVLTEEYPTQQQQPLSDHIQVNISDRFIFFYSST